MSYFGFQFEKALCPICESLPDGILEKVECKALIQKVPHSERSMLFDYAGESKIFWDTQEPVAKTDDIVTLFCSKCHTEWKSKMITVEGP